MYEKYLDSFINYENDLKSIQRTSFKLERMKKLLELFGNPQDNLNIIHVAGSKGKGSTCAMTASILKEAGFKVGLYTSPHINSYRERIRILDIKKENGKKRKEDIFYDSISKKELENIVLETKDKIEEFISGDDGDGLSFFEIFTFYAIYYFNKNKVDWVILEVGLGGRLDATNATNALICAVMPISLEHTNILGNRIEDIAKEKIAIIKNSNQSVVVSKQLQVVDELIYNHCKQLNVKPLFVSKNIDFKVLNQSLNELNFVLNDVKFCIPSIGEHQIINAATSLCIIECVKRLGNEISDDAVYNGLKYLNWPLRFEVVNDERIFVLDCAHSVSSAEALVKTFKEIFKAKKANLILGISNDKEIKAICEILSQITKDVIITKANHPRAYSFREEEIKLYFREKKFEFAENVAKAIRIMKHNTQRGDIVLITGSIFLVSEAGNIIKQKNEKIKCTN